MPQSSGEAVWEFPLTGLQAVSAVCCAVQLKQAILSLQTVHEGHQQLGAAPRAAPLDEVLASSAAAETQGLVDKLRQEEEALQQRLSVIDAQLQYEQVPLQDLPEMWHWQIPACVLVGSIFVLMLS